MLLFSSKDVESSEDESDADDPYENIDEIRRIIQKNPQSSAPEPPPRNSILKPAKTEELVDKPEVGENVYSECSSSWNTRDRSQEHSLFDREG